MNTVILRGARKLSKKFSAIKEKFRRSTRNGDFSYAICYDTVADALVMKNSKQMNEHIEDGTFFMPLSLKDVKRFGSVYREEKKKSKNSKKETMLCTNCGKWIDGFCFKHPLVFIQEKIPRSKKYFVTETLPPFFYLANSTIPNAGKGIFTNMVLPAGIAFGPYSGVHSNESEKVCSRYSWQVSDLDGLPSWVDAESMHYTNWMRYVNCPRSIYEQNMVGVLYRGQIYYYTFRRINAGEELFVWYGADYGVSLKIPNADKSYGPLAPDNYEYHDETGHYIGDATQGYVEDAEMADAEDAEAAVPDDEAQAKIDGDVEDHDDDHDADDDTN